MIHWRHYLPEPKADKKKIPNWVMVRPPQRIAEWLFQESRTHKQSINKIVLAILEQAYQHAKTEEARLKERLGPSVSEQLAAADSEKKCIDD